MTRKPRQVDLGPMYLPVGEEAGFPVERDGLASDAARFDDILGAGLRSRNTSDRPARALLQADEGPSVADLASHVQNLWEREEGSTEAEVRVLPGHHVSPHTSLRLLVRSGTLHVEIHCNASANSAWFIPRLPPLAEDLVLRLRRRICVSLFGPTGFRIGHFESSEEHP